MHIVEGKAYKVPCEGSCRDADGPGYHIVVKFGVQPMICDCPAGKHGLICKHRIAVAKMAAQESPLAGWR